MTKRFSLVLAAVFFLCCNGAAQVSVKFVWFGQRNVDTYRLQVATDSTFAAPLTFDLATITDTTITVTTMLPVQKYYWRVSATNVGGTGPWSQVWNFTTAPQIPNAVILYSPFRGAIGVKW